MLLKKMLGKEVLYSNGDLAGKVSDIEMDLVNGAIKQVVIKRGLSKAFSVNSDDVITAGDRIIIRNRKMDTKKVETFNFLGIKRRLLCNW